MKISFKCSYQGKPNGFEDMSFNSNKEFIKESIMGSEGAILNKSYGKSQSIYLILTSEKKLSCIFVGIGRRVPNMIESPWGRDNDITIINMVVTEEEIEERGAILSLFVNSCKNYYEVSRNLLGLIEKTPYPEDGREYLFNYDSVKSWIDNATSYDMPEINALENSVILYFSPTAVLTSDEKKALITKFKENNFNAEKNIILDDPDDYAKVLKNTSLLEDVIEQVTEVAINVKDVVKDKFNKWFKK